MIRIGNLVDNNQFRDNVYKSKSNSNMGLREEGNEFLKDKNLEELADVMEVLFGLTEALGYSEEELLKVRDKKREERGGFKEGIALKSVK